MENKNGGASSKGVLEPVSETSDLFHNSVLAPLRSAYLYEESKQSFRYKSAFLINNPKLEEQYNAFRAKRREAGYSEEDLKESYGFLLFDDVNKANSLGETGVLTGNSTCTTLGDPSLGVYISTYSDCLDPNRWYHGKSGYIAIIRLTKGRVKTVSENYTKKFTEPSVGFDCHVSKQLSAVSANTSSFLAFERTQYYMYELLHDGTNETAQSLSHACPYAVVSFSYADTKTAPFDPQEKCVEERMVCHYLPWRGQLQMSTQFFDVGLKSTTGALIPAKLPEVVKVDKAISMLDLRQLLPKSIFETCISGEVSLDGICCSLYELVSSKMEDSSLSGLIQELKEKDLALITQLNDGGFLMLLHSSHFLKYDGTGSSATEVLQGMFVFPDSRAVQRDTKVGQRKSTISSEVLQVLPALNYAESEVEKRSTDQSEELCGLLVQHMQNYATLINPGLAASPSREVSIIPDQYDVPDALKHLYTAPKWTNRAWQNLRSYLSQPVSFQLPVSTATELLAAGQEERRDLDDEVYICLSSPEEALATPSCTGSEDRVGGQESPEHAEASVDSPIGGAEAQEDSTNIPQACEMVPDILQSGDATKDIEKPGLAVLSKTGIITGPNSLLVSPTSGELPAELIVSITSAEGTAGVIDESLSVISAVSSTKHHEIQLSDLSTAKLQTAVVNSLNDKTDKAKNPSDCVEVSHPPKTHQGKLHKGLPKSNPSSKSSVKTLSVQTVRLPVEVDTSVSENHDKAKQHLSDHLETNKPLKTDWRKLRRRRKVGKLSSKNKRVKSAAVKLMEKKTETNESDISTELEAYPLRKKTERWDLKPIISQCGRILVPYGSVDTADQLKTLKDKQKATEDEQCLDKMTVDTPLKGRESVAIEQESIPALEITGENTETTKNIDGANPLQNPVVSDINSEHSEERQLDGGGSVVCKLDTKDQSSEIIAEANDKDPPPSEAVQKKHTDTPSLAKNTKTSKFLFSKLKSVILGGKRKTSDLVSEAVSVSSAQGTEPYPKKSKSDMDVLKSNDSERSVLDTGVGTEEVSKMSSVDPKFAKALGLTPKELPNKAQKIKCQDTPLKGDSSSLMEQTISDESPQPTQRPSLVLRGKARMKPLKRHAGISPEHIKRKCTSFQVPPLSGSAGLQLRHQNRHDDGIQALHCRKDKCGHKHGAPSNLQKGLLRRRKFRHSRTFVDKDGSVQVTRQWKENYDFSLDSKFTNDSQDKTVIRALHGPWDLTIQDTNEEVRLIVHMWIGLFYSRSTARFFHIDPNFTCPYSEGSESLEVSSGIVSATPQSELKDSSSAPLPTTSSDSSISKALDLRKKDTPVLNQGAVILDLSLRNPSAETVSSDSQALSHKQTEATPTSEVLRSSPGLHEPSTAYQHQAQNQSHREKLDCITSPVSDVGGTCVNESASPQKAGCQECTDIISLKSDGKPVLLCEEVGKEGIQLNNVLDGSHDGKTEMGDCSENWGTTEMDLIQQVGVNSSKTMADREIHSKCDSADLVHTVERDEIESQQGEHTKLKEKTCQEDNVESSPTLIHINDSTDKESDKVSDVHHLENQVQLSGEELKTLSPVRSENVSEDRNDLKHDNGSNDNGSNDNDVHHGMEDEIDLKESFVSVVEPSSDFNDKSSSTSCDRPGSMEGCIEKCNEKVTPSEDLPQMDSDNDACKNSSLQCANSIGVMGEDDISGVPQVALNKPSHAEQIHNESVDEGTPVHSDICSLDGVHSKKATLLLSDENSHSPRKSCTASHPTKDGTIRKNQKEVEAKFCNQSSGDYEDQDSKSGENARNVDQVVVIKLQKDQTGILVKEADNKKEIKDEKSEKLHGQDEITSIGIESFRQDALHPQVLYPQEKAKDLVQCQKEIMFIKETKHHEGVLDTDVYNTSQNHSEKVPLLAGKRVSAIDFNESESVVCKETESDDRCPTPTMDEKPYDYIPHPDPCSSISASAGEKVCRNFTQKDLKGSSTPTHDELPFEWQLCHESSVKSHPDPQCDLSHVTETVHPDLELRTLRVLSSIDKYLYKSSHTDESNQFEKADLYLCRDQTPRFSSKYIPTSSAPFHTYTLSKEKKINKSSGVASASAKQDLPTKSLHFLKSLFKNKFSSKEELLLHVQPKESDFSIPEDYSKRRDDMQDSSFRQDSYHPCTTFHSSEDLKAVQPSTEQDTLKATLHYNLGNEPRSSCQRPIMAVKPSKSDEIQADYVSKKDQIDTSVISAVPRSTQTKTPVASNTKLTTALTERQTVNFKGVSENLVENEREGIECSSTVNRVSNDQDKIGTLNSNKAKGTLPDSLYPYQSGEISNVNMIPSSSFSIQPTESEKGCTGIVDGNQDFLENCLVEKIGLLTEESFEMDEEDSTVPVSDDHPLGSSVTSLTCTIFNSGRKRPYSLLEHLSQRCLQNDLIQSSLEQECLIFSEQMKQLLKRSKKGPLHSHDKSYDRSKVFCTSPVTVDFSSLEEQEDSVDPLEALPSLVDQKIKIDMPERKGLVDNTEVNTFHLQKLSNGKGNSAGHCGISDVTAECARLYQAMMNDVCAGKRLPTNINGSRMDTGFPKSDSSKHLDFSVNLSGQMKREMYESFHTNLNLVVRRSWKTKFRFFIVMTTSDDDFFEKTKALLEAEGHTAVQPSQFFLDDDRSSSPLLIILRNEDIAENICEVPRLLELRNSPDVLFAGTDEPDDIVNLTHQDLLTGGGFIMFERTALEALSLGNMTKISQFVEELSKKRKWKWMLHYRDSRQLKENARLSAAAKEKKHFMSCCQEAGIVEVLPYHECDLMSRDRPDYLNCLVRLQVQNISARFPVFITDTAADSAFGKKGILTMNTSSFLMLSPSEAFTV
ncbi:uncharacterized protein tasor2 isoform X2 [Myripristis murdjan]|uniref:uncharacterized protein tasor2 isoform X2 n=1 Tax=Myripristis murdjan TaxID=586833 RepID=UPI001175D909|nr:protein FAM208B isoform X2 [Myripristis murdjan]